MAIFNSYVKLPEGNPRDWSPLNGGFIFPTAPASQGGGLEVDMAITQPGYLLHSHGIDGP